MLIFNVAGRLGNQLFEYAYVQSIRKHLEPVWLLGFDDLYRIFDVRDFNFNSKADTEFKAWFTRKTGRLFIKLRNTRLISFVKEITETRLGELRCQKGVLPVNFIEGYFQTDRYITDDFFNSISFKKKYTDEAEKILAGFPENKKICFIHVRHGDYEEDMRLPDSFYLNALKKFDLENTFFYIAGDDPSWAEKTLSFLPHKAVSRNSMAADLYIMAHCKGGIISNSTFAWWGAVMAQHNAGKEKIEIHAPEYWIGWKKKQWIPTPLIKTGSFIYESI